MSFKGDCQMRLKIVMGCSGSKDFSQANENIGLPRLHPHLLRHTFAVNYLMNGRDVFTLQQILGHTTLEMVRRYVNLANAHVMTQHKRFSPVDRMNLRQVSRAVTLQKGRGRMRKAGVAGR